MEGDKKKKYVKVIKLESHSKYTHHEAAKRIKDVPQNQKQYFTEENGKEIKCKL